MLVCGGVALYSSNKGDFYNAGFMAVFMGVNYISYWIQCKLEEIQDQDKK